MNDDRLEPLFRDECLRLLATQQVGRLGVIEGGAPMVVPVNYVLDGDEVVFRSDPGTKLTHGRRGPVCFEVDSFDEVSRTGWSVLIRGRLEEVPSLDAAVLRNHVTTLPIVPWAGGRKAHWVRLIATAITGRALPALTNV